MSLANYSRFLCGEIPKRHTSIVQLTLCEGLPWVTFIKLVFPTFFFDSCIVRYLNSTGQFTLPTIQSFCSTKSIFSFHFLNVEKTWKRLVPEVAEA